MLFFRQLRHLLPDGQAWRATVEKTLRKFLVGISSAPSDARDFVDDVYGDLHPETTRELEAWEEEFAITPNGTDEERRVALAAAWSATGGQSPRYLQDLVQAAGFDLYIHEWWEPPGGTPWTPRDPNNYTVAPLFGTTQCGEADAQCGEEEAQCDRFLVNDPRYLVNKTRAREAPPPIPSSSAYWPYFLYWGAETFGVDAEIPESRREELERLLLKYCPSHLWLVMMVTYLAPLLTDTGETLTTDTGEELLAKV